LSIALQSLKECVVCITIAKNQNYISADENQQFREDLTELSKMISGLRKYLKHNGTND
jgi:four helix bundle protein